MRMRIAVALAMVCAPMLAGATIVELSPDLYLVIRERGRRESPETYKIAVIDEANRFAFSKGMVAAPISGRSTYGGSYLHEFEYQFQLMSRTEALAAKPTLADVVVAVDGVDTCGQHAAPTVAALMPELSKLEEFRERGLLAANKLEEEEEAQDAPAPAPPSAEPSTQ